MEKRRRKKKQHSYMFINEGEKNRIPTFIILYFIRWNAINIREKCVCKGEASNE